MPPQGIEPATHCFPACPSNHSAIGRDINMLLESNPRPLAFQRVPLTTRPSGEIRHVVRTFAVLFEETILQELCNVCKGYIENKNKRTVLTYSFCD